MISAANKQKWISYEMLLQMLQEIYEYYMSSGDVDKAEDELKAALKLLDVFNNLCFESYRDFFTHKLSKI